MRPLLVGLALALCLTVHLSNAAPAGTELQADHQQQETLETLHLGEPGSDDTTVRDKRTIGPLRQLFPGLSQAEAENQLAGAESQISEVRVQLNDKQDAAEAEEQEEEDLKPAASGDNLADEGAADLENEAEGGADDENRNKRFLPFNLGGAGGGGSSGAASGNFLFDIIRLIAGSGTTQAQDEADNAPLDGSTSSGGISASASANAEGKDDGYQEGVPGPITRLFVIANRGIANLVQDLILRLAQTSERLVNFKARLITSII